MASRYKLKKSTSKKMYKKGQKMHPVNRIRVRRGGGRL
jgi:hypothetical protein